MTRMMLTVSTAMGVLCLIAPAAHADVASVEAACSDFYNQDAIDACTVLIQSGKLSKQDLGDAYYYRAKGYAYDDQYALASQDEDMVIELDPNDAQAYDDRAQDEFSLAQLQNDSLTQFRAAIEDDSKAIELEPDKAKFYVNRATIEQVVFKVTNDESYESAEKTDWAKACSLDSSMC